MITVTKNIVLNNVALPLIEYFFTPSDPCVSITDVSITDNIISVTITFSDAECIQFNPVVQLFLQDANGCKKTFNITIPNPCINFTTTGIVAGPQFSFRIPFTGGTGPFTYEWLFDTNLFELDREVQNNLFLNPIGDFIAGQTTNVQVTVTDANGCEITGSIDYEICGPVFDLEIFETICKGQERFTTRIFLNITSCGSPIDWTTLFVDVPESVTFESLGDGSVAFIFPENFPTGTVVFPATVETFDGVLGAGEIIINVINCDRSPDIVPFSFNFECEACEVPPIGFNRDEEENPFCFGPIAVHIPDLMVDADIDWTTFTFVQGPGQILVSPTEIYTQYGHAEFNSNQDVVYEPDVDLVFEVIVYRVTTFDGITLQGNLTFSKDFCAIAPIAINDDLCVACGETLGPINLLANDLGDIDPSSFTFLGPFPTPSQGVLTISPNGIISFTPSTDFNGQVVFQYTVDNFDGVTSNVATVTIDVNCIEETNFEVSYCINDANVNLWTLIGASNMDSSWFFVGYSVEQGGTPVGQTFSVNGLAPQFYLPNQQITLSNLATVDLTNSPAGFYVFQYMGGECVPDVLVTIETIDLPQLEDVQFTVCFTDGSVNLDLLVPDLPEGVWNFNGEGFVDPVYTFTETGTFEFHYVVDGEGEFGEVCDSTFTLTLIVENLGFNPGFKQITVCTEGPAPS